MAKGGVVMNPSEMTNRQLMTEYERGGRMAAVVLPEMAKRVGTYKALTNPIDPMYLDSVIRDTIAVFKQYKLNGGQDDHY
jgi:hypothetical protein